MCLLLHSCLAYKTHCVFSQSRAESWNSYSYHHTSIHLVRTKLYSFVFDLYLLQLNLCTSAYKVTHCTREKASPCWLFLSTFSWCCLPCVLLFDTISFRIPPPNIAHFSVLCTMQKKPFCKRGMPCRYFWYKK